MTCGRWLFGQLSGVSGALGQRYLMNGINLAIRDRGEDPVYLVAGFRKRQQNCPIKNVTILVTRRAAVTDGLLLFRDAPDMPRNQFQQRAFEAFRNTLPVEGWPCRIAQGISHMREA